MKQVGNKNKIYSSIKKPRNIVFIIFMLASLIIGILDDTIEIIIIIYFGFFLLGKTIGWIINLINR
ncbi:hypothetical protein BTO04_07300 [Polaribacter sp. SA4-10]|nr:hypothetical protein BTO04_07300 [Polaribacter sp. SA4-10]